MLRVWGVPARRVRQYQQVLQSAQVILLREKVLDLRHQRDERRQRVQTERVTLRTEHR